MRNRMVVGFSSTNLMGIDEDSHDSNPHSCSVRLWVANKWEYSPLSGCNTETLTVDHIIVGNMFGECHTPHTQKNPFVDFEKEQAHGSRYRRLNISSQPTLHTISVADSSL